MNLVKTCTKCEIEKPISEYCDVRSQCKLCIKEYKKKYREKNKEMIRLDQKYHYEKNKKNIKNAEENGEKLKEYEKLKEQHKEYRKKKIRESGTKTCNKCEIEKSISEYYKRKTGKYGVRSWCKICEKEYQMKNKERSKKYNIKYNEKNKEHRKKNYEKNKKQISKVNCEYAKKNRKIINKRNIIRYKNDIQFKITSNVRKRLRSFLKTKSIYKDNKIMLSVGCSKKYLTDWIQYNKVLDNLNEYHIDHLKPLASFNCETYEEVIECKCNHWTNLIPTTPEYNLIKSDREPTKHEIFKQELRIYLFKKSMKS